MSYHGLTTNSQIRSVLTVSEADLPDEMLSAYGIEDDLAVDLDGWVPIWETIVTEGTPLEAVEGEPAPPATDAEKVKQLRLLRLYSKYFCASVVAATAPVFVLTKMTDGSNEGQRSDADGFLWLSQNLRTKANQHKLNLLEALEQPVQVETMTLISRVRPARDPVTQPREAEAE